MANRIVDKKEIFLASEGVMKLSHLPLGKVKLVIPDEFVNKEKGTVSLDQMVFWLNEIASQEMLTIEYRTIVEEDKA